MGRGYYMQPYMHIERRQSIEFRISWPAPKSVPRWLAVPAPADEPKEQTPNVALGLAISVVTSLVFWSGIAALLIYTPF
ncbi:hypothetical protein LK12_04165 [Novosphingobium malaysiense]|uniref:Uncharacterized protein n=1 Tax=Novosphingobium malaysiense TaxID=1348853 RepID=A0A0B1ZS78_9SPHN|nr:hypothetical protein LK12_04165 [Novosphingobium malaysiense]